MAGKLSNAAEAARNRKPICIPNDHKAICKSKSLGKKTVGNPTAEFREENDQPSV